MENEIIEHTPETPSSPKPAAKRSLGQKLVWGSLIFTLICAIIFGCLHHNGMIVVDGEPVGGIMGLGFAFIAVIFGLLAALLGAAIAMFVTIGVGLFVAMLFAGIMIAVVVALSPFALPFVAFGFFVLWLVRQTRAKT